MSEVSMDANEAYVRANWEHGDSDSSITAAYLGSDGHIKVPIRDGVVDWAAAAEFTRERREQIRQVEDEIAWLKSIAMSERTYGINPSSRILSRLESIRDDLRKGMKEAGNAK